MQKKPNQRIEAEHMLRTIELAQNGAGFVSPNPLVGCLIAVGKRVAGEGYHRKFGGPHAEIEALRKCRMSARARQSATLYVNLEPCVAYEQKKTPACAEAIIASGIRHVVVGMKDPNPKVSGRGIRALRRAGIRVEVGVLERECAELNEIYCHWITTGRPFVLLKLAVTLDGALTFKRGTRSAISSTESLAYAHELRQLYDAIALGSESILIDDPLLTTRRKGKKSRNPIRVIFDRRGRVRKSANMFKQPGKTIIFSSSLSSALDQLGRDSVTSILVEGGKELAGSFLREGLVDKLMIAVAPRVASRSDVPRFSWEGIELLRSVWEIRGEDAWLVGYVKKKNGAR